MRISFDLDDTLICYEPEIPREKCRVPFWARLVGAPEPLREGAVQLLRELIDSGHEIWIYTTSCREPKAVKRWLGFYGIPIQSVINAEVHARAVPERMRRTASKAPAAFGIALHIDDEDSISGDFELLTISKSDENWADKVRETVRRLESANY